MDFSFPKIKRWQKRLLITCFIFLAIYIFKGSVYRTCFSYELIRCRNEQTFGDDSKVATRGGKDENDIIDFALKNTASELSFTTGKCETNEKALYQGAKTNCIGYANECAMLCNNEFWSYGLSTSFKAETFVAQIHFFGYNIHHLFSSPFWKDHDVVVITNLQNGEKTILDPTLYDYTGIGIVSERK